MNKHKIIEVWHGGRCYELKAQEIDLLRLVCEDIPYVEIARRMSASPRTVEGYRDRLFVKLGVRSRTGLIIWTLKTGVVKLKNLRLRTLDRQLKKKKPR